MIGLVAAAALMLAGPSGAQADVTANQIGRLSFYAGVCSTLGWESSRERAMAGAEAWQLARPETNEAENVAQLEQGLADARAELNAVIEVFRSDRDTAAFARALKTRCDDAARLVPEMINRADDTDTKFEAALPRITQGILAP